MSTGRCEVGERYGATFSINKVQIGTADKQMNIKRVYPATSQGARVDRLVAVAPTEGEGIFAVEAKILFFETQ
jgi:hypothetical protein